MLNIDPVTRHILKNFSGLCIPTRAKVFRLLKKYKHLGAYYGSASTASNWSRFDSGVIIPAKTKAKKLVISHIDLIPTFERGFPTGQAFSLVFDANNFDMLVGALDNGITNAVLSTYLDLNILPDDVEVLFSLGEETGSTGVKSFLAAKDDAYFEDLVVINLDVSNDNFGLNGSIEFDYADPLMFELFDNSLDNVGTTTDRFCDDVDAVLDKTNAAFSYCLPTDNVIHSYKNYALLESVLGYYTGLQKIISELDLVYNEKSAEKYRKKNAKKLFNKHSFEDQSFQGEGSWAFGGTPMIGHH